MSSSAHALGRSVPRLEDAPLLKGHGQFVADIAFTHQLHMRIVRSPYAHAELRSVDVTAALAATGWRRCGSVPPMVRILFPPPGQVIGFTGWSRSSSGRD